MASLIARRCKHSGVPEQFDSYIEIPSGQPGARTNKRGSCKSCRKETSLTLARMAAHFLEKKGHGVSVCTVKDSPVAAALATEAANADYHSVATRKGLWRRGVMGSSRHLASWLIHGFITDVWVGCKFLLEMYHVTDIPGRGPEKAADYDAWAITVFSSPLI